MDKSDPVGKTHNISDRNTARDKTVQKCLPFSLYVHLQTRNNHRTTGSRHFTTPLSLSPNTTSSCSGAWRLTGGTPLKLLLPLFDKLCGFFTISYLIALAQTSPGTPNCGSRLLRILYFLWWLFCNVLCENVSSHVRPLLYA